MASVPLQSFSSVAPDATVPNDYQHIDASPADFGALQGQAAEKTGGQIEQAGTSLEQIAQLRQQRFNQTATDGAFNNFQTGADNLTYGNPSDPTAPKGLYTLRGSAALDAGPGAVKSISDMRDQIRGGLQNDAQRLQFDEQSRRLMEYKSAEISRHLDAQSDVYAIATNEATIATSAKSAGNAWNSDDAIKHAQEDARGGSVKAFQVKYGVNMSPELTQQAIQQADNTVIKSAIMSASVQNPARAQQILDAHISELDPATQVQLTQHLKSVNVGHAADAAVGAAIGRPTVGTPAYLPPDIVDRAQAVHDEFVRQGTDSDEAWGWAANAVHESSANPATKPGDGGASHGIFQWNADRLAAYQASHGGHLPEQDSLESQVAFARNEMDGTQSAAAPAIRNANGPEGKAAAISANFIRPKDVGREASDRAATAQILAQGSGAGANLPSYDSALAKLMETTADNPAAQQQGIAKLNRLYAASQKVAKETYEKFANPLVSQMITDPTKIDPVKDIANNPAFNSEQKSNLSNMLTKHLGDYATGGDGDSKKYGPGFWDYYKAVNADSGDPGKITDPQILIKAAGPGGSLTVAGVEKLTTALQGRRTPEGIGEQTMMTQFLKNAKSQISGQSEGLGSMRDPKGEEFYQGFLTQALPAFENGKKAGIPAAELLNPKSPQYIGKLIDGFKRSNAQWGADMDHDPGFGPTNPNSLPQAQADTPGAGTKRNLGSIAQDVQMGRLTNEAGKAEAMRLGLIKPDPVAAPPAAPGTLIPTN